MTDVAVTPEAALQLFADLAAMEAGLHEFYLDESISWVKAIKRSAELKRFFDAKPRDVISVVDRPRDPDAEWFKAHREAGVSKRVIHAAAPMLIDKEEVIAVYTASREVDLEMQNRFIVARVGVGWRQHELKIISRYVTCGECSTKLGLALKDNPDAEITLAGCGVCKRQGWRFAGGHEHRKPKPNGDVLRVTEPTDAKALKVYNAL